MWESTTSTDKFYTRGITLYPQEELFKEMSFISYYFHWSETEVMKLEHNQRRRWCAEISAIHKTVNPSKQSQEKSILDFKVTR